MKRKSRSISRRTALPSRRVMRKDLGFTSAQRKAIFGKQAKSIPIKLFQYKIHNDLRNELSRTSELLKQLQKESKSKRINLVEP